MRLKTQRRAIYVAMGLTALALSGGFALASLSLGGSSNMSYQGSHTTSVTDVAGLNWTATEPTMTSGITNTTNCDTVGGCSVSASSATVCAGTTHAPSTWCAADDFVEQVVLQTSGTTAFSNHAVNVTMYVATTLDTYTGTTFHFTDGASNSAETITVDFDIGSSTSGPAAVTSVTVIVTA